MPEIKQHRFRTVVLKVGGTAPFGAILRSNGVIGGEKTQSGLKRSTTTINRSLSNFDCDL